MSEQKIGLYDSTGRCNYCGGESPCHFISCPMVQATYKLVEPPSVAPAPDALQLAIMFHEAYERLAPSFGYETRTETRAFDPESKNGRLMVATCGELLRNLSPAPAASAAPDVPSELDAESLIHWLEAKYKRHGEIEDHAAAAMLRALSRTAAERGERIAHLEAALNGIASWGEGAEVSGSFDEPCSADAARRALAPAAQDGNG